MLKVFADFQQTDDILLVRRADWELSDTLEGLPDEFKLAWREVWQLLACNAFV
jgi:hypothetical protein